MEKEKSKIFIASGGRSLGLAQAMREALGTDYSEASIWNVESEGRIPITRQAVRDYDFAVIILTREDLTLKEGAHDVLRQVRDNCIYELGFLMNELGLSRCFLISGATSDTLPVDIRNIQYTLIQEPPDLQDLGACAEAVRTASEEIKKAIQGNGKLIRGKSLPVLAPAEIMKRERPTGYGGQLEEGFVVISDSHPLESTDFAMQIKGNLDNGVRYVYFFPASEDGAQRICWLLQMILVADLYKESGQAESFPDRGEAIKRNREFILKNIEVIYLQESLQIYFTPTEPALQFRIHNASSVTNAKAYFRYGDGFVEYAEGGDATSIWHYIKLSTKPQQPRAIFRSSDYYDLQSEEAQGFRASLDRELKRHFTEINEEVKKFCYGEA